MKLATDFMEESDTRAFAYRSIQGLPLGIEWDHCDTTSNQQTDSSESNHVNIYSQQASWFFKKTSIPKTHTQVQEKEKCALSILPSFGASTWFKFTPGNDHHLVGIITLGHYMAPNQSVHTGLCGKYNPKETNSMQCILVALSKIYKWPFWLV